MLKYGALFADLLSGKLTHKADKSETDVGISLDEEAFVDNNLPSPKGKGDIAHPQFAMYCFNR